MTVYHHYYKMLIYHIVLNSRKMLSLYMKVNTLYFSKEATKLHDIQNSVIWTQIHMLTKYEFIW
jgi:hypothetical protein